MKIEYKILKKEKFQNLNKKLCTGIIIYELIISTTYTIGK